MKFKMKKINYIIYCLSVFLFIHSSLAQTTTISVRTMQLGGDEMPESWVQVADEKEPVKLTWLTTQPTEPLQVIHDGNLKLYHYVLNPEGGTVLEVMETIKLPESANEVLLLARAKDGVAKYVIIKDLFLTAKFNDWIAINISANPVAILAGDKGKPARVAPGKSVLFRPQIEEGKGVKILAKTQRNGELKTFLSSYWPAFAGQRTMMIFYDDGDKMRAKRIGDRFVKKKEEPE